MAGLPLDRRAGVVWGLLLLAGCGQSAAPLRTETAPPPQLTAEQLALPEAASSTTDSLATAPPSRKNAIPDPQVQVASSDDWNGSESEVERLPVPELPQGLDLSPVEDTAPSVVRSFDDASGTPPQQSLAARRGAPEVVAARLQAEEIARHGFDLANRGALFSARTEFLAALEAIARAYSDSADRRSSEALTLGLTALEEAAEFSSESEANRSEGLRRIVARHRTPLLQQAELAELSASSAISQYETYAQQQLIAAACQEPAASLALYGLGRSYVAASQGDTAGDKQLAQGQAMACYQAAFHADPTNFRAVHELGVVLSGMGMNEAACQCFERANQIRPSAASAQNLAVIYQRLGQPNLAERARRQALALAPRSAPARPQIQWVDAQTFVQNAPKAQANQAPSAPGVQTRPTLTGARPTAPNNLMTR